jgi:hypothetical protein
MKITRRQLRKLIMKEARMHRRNIGRPKLHSPLEPTELIDTKPIKKSTWVPPEDEPTEKIDIEPAWSPDNYTSYRQTIKDRQDAAIARRNKAEMISKMTSGIIPFDNEDYTEVESDTEEAGALAPEHPIDVGGDFIPAYRVQHDVAGKAAKLKKDLQEMIRAEIFKMLR